MSTGHCFAIVGLVELLLVVEDLSPPPGLHAKLIGRVLLLGSPVHALMAKIPGTQSHRVSYTVDVVETAACFNNPFASSPFVGVPRV